MADAYTGYLNVGEEIPEEGISIKLILAIGAAVVGFFILK